MGKTISNIQVLYEEMGSAEKRIADFIINNSQDLLSLSISELAQKCNCGEATVTRFAKRLNLSGYQQLKISIAKEKDWSKVYENISKEDSPSTILAKFATIYTLLLKRLKQK